MNEKFINDFYYLQVEVPPSFWQWLVTKEGFIRTIIPTIVFSLIFGVFMGITLSVAGGYFFYIRTFQRMEDYLEYSKLEEVGKKMDDFINSLVLDDDDGRFG